MLAKLVIPCGGKSGTWLTQFLAFPQVELELCRGHLLSFVSLSAVINGTLGRRSQRIGIMGNKGYREKYNRGVCIVWGSETEKSLLKMVELGCVTQDIYSLSFLLHQLLEITFS